MHQEVDPAVLLDERFRHILENLDARTHLAFYRGKAWSLSRRMRDWVGSIDYSGHVREECLTSLISDYLPGDENRIFLRVADWVPEVASIAKRWVSENFRELPFESLAANSRLLLFLSRRESLQGDPVLDCIHRELQRKVLDAGEIAFHSLAAPLRRHILRLSLAGDQALREWVLRDPDPSNRSILLESPEKTRLAPDEATRFRGDRSAMVRRRYLRFRLSQRERIGREELIEFAFDRRRGLRQIAGFYLKQLHGLDAYELYRDTEGDARYFVADYAKPEDLDVFMAGMASGSKQVRHLCIQAICKIDPFLLLKLDIPTLLADSKLVRRTVLPYLPEVCDSAQLRSLRHCLLRTLPGGEVSYLHLIERKSYWLFVHSALEAISEGAASDVLEHIQRIVLGRAQVVARLSAPLRAAITERLTCLQEMDDPAILRLCQRVEFTMRYV